MNYLKHLRNTLKVFSWFAYCVLAWVTISASTYSVYHVSQGHIDTFWQGFFEFKIIPFLCLIIVLELLIPTFKEKE
jgi:putative copper export protein